jgi:uncharacterized protein YbjT (DUF2867 family)
MAAILVTGSRGHVGREVVIACRERGLPTRLGLHTPAAEADAVRFDFEDPPTWRFALAGCDRVFLLRPPPISDMHTTLIPFIDVAYAAGVQHLVFLSVAGAERSSWIPHRKVELHLEKLDTAWTILRPGFFDQNLADAYRTDIVEDHRLYVPAGTGKIAFLDVRDVGEVVATIFSDPEPYRRQALTLTGPESLSFTEVAQLLTEVLGTSIRYEPASIAGYVRHLRRRKLSWTQTLVQTILHVGLRRGDAESVQPTVERILGRTPTPLRAYVERVVETWSPAAR